MQIEIDLKRNNPLLQRTEVYFTIKHEGEGTPNRDIIKSELADKLNVKKENIVVNIIKSSFGVQEASGYAKVYTSINKTKDLESKFILKRNKLIEGFKKTEKKAEEIPSSLPSQEIIEETVKEQTIDQTVDEKSGDKLSKETISVNETQKSSEDFKPEKSVKEETIQDHFQGEIKKEESIKKPLEEKHEKVQRKDSDQKKESKEHKNEESEKTEEVKKE
jgi:small subunit ribosomal protein S24e